LATTDTGAPHAGDAFVVRRVRQDEWRELRALRLRALADAPDAFGATLADAEAEPDEAWQERAEADRVTIVAEVEGRLVGMAAGGTAPIDGSTAALYSMWVEPAQRGTGMAAAIVGAIVDWARRAGYQGLGLGVTTTNARAIAFYERLGFVDNGMRFPLREGADLEIQIMIRPLAEDG
jgi:GNAT superfamily N-acetyltransferase